MVRTAVQDREFHRVTEYADLEWAILGITVPENIV